jgi:SAM-dependent methyltransferase
LQRGWDAWGADVVPEYLEHGRRYLRSKGFSTERLVDMGDPSRLADNSFNVVISNQVLEHVADLQSFVATVARVSTPGALGLHIFPGRWILIEPHIRAPLFHWLPKGPARRLALRAVIAAGVGVDYFSEFQPHERLEIFLRYSEMHTFYRSRSTISATFARAGMSCEFTTVAPDRQVPAGLARNAAHLVAGRSALVGMTHLRTNI